MRLDCLHYRDDTRWYYCGAFMRREIFCNPECHCFTPKEPEVKKRYNTNCAHAANSGRVCAMGRSAKDCDSGVCPNATPHETFSDKTARLAEVVRQEHIQMARNILKKFGVEPEPKWPVIKHGVTVVVCKGGYCVFNHVEGKYGESCSLQGALEIADAIKKD